MEAFMVTAVYFDICNIRKLLNLVFQSLLYVGRNRET
jgi:hypothetical protein